MELLEKMHKDTRDHELRLVQTLGQMMVCPAVTPTIAVLDAASTVPTVPQPSSDAHTKHLQFNQ